jgi:hypothetical protein
VTISASRTEQGDALCEPFTQTFPLTPGAAGWISLPYVIAVEPGDTYDKVLFIRVVGLASGTVRYKTERMVSLSGGEVIVDIRLTEDCLGVGTGRGMHCFGGFPLESPYWQIFDENLHVESGQSCLRL